MLQAPPRPADQAGVPATDADVEASPLEKIVAGLAAVIRRSRLEARRRTILLQELPMAEAEIDHTTRSAELREELNQLDEQMVELAVFPAAHWLTPSRIAGISGMVLLLVLAVIPAFVSVQLGSPAAQPSPYVSLDARAEALIEKKLAEFRAQERTEKIKPEAREELDRAISKDVTDLFATVDPPGVEIAGSAEQRLSDIDIGKPEYDRSLSRWSFFLRFNVQQAVTQQGHGFRFRAYDPTGTAIAEGPIRLLSGAPAGDRVLGAISVQDATGSGTLLAGLSSFRIFYQENTAPPGRPQVQAPATVQMPRPIPATAGSTLARPRLGGIRVYPNGAAGSILGGGLFVPAAP